MKIKLLSVILSLTMLMSLMISCANKEEPGKPTEYDGMVIDAEYTVVRSEKGNNSVINTARKLKEAINQKSGVDVGFGTDFVKRGGEAPAKEILVGAVDRELEFDRTTLDVGDFYIGIEGDKIIIDAYDELTLNAFVEQIIEVWLKEDCGIVEKGVLIINESICKKLNEITFSLPQTISVLSQNVRSADDPNGNSVAERQPRFKKLVEEYDPDLIGTQEVTKKWKTYIEGTFSKDYGMVGCSRSGRTSTGGEFNLILYKKARFELLESDTFWLTDTPSTPSKVQDSKFNRICTWALLKDKLTGETFLFANTHFDYYGIDNGRIMYQQAQYLMQELGEKFAQYPSFLTGDFNCQRNSQAYSYLANSFKDAEKTADVNTSTVKATVSGYGMNPTYTIDFCFYNEKMHPVHFRITENKYGGDVSDHFGIFTEFTFEENKE